MAFWTQSLEPDGRRFLNTKWQNQKSILHVFEVRDHCFEGSFAVQVGQGSVVVLCAHCLSIRRRHFSSRFVEPETLSTHRVTKAVVHPCKRHRVDSQSGGNEVFYLQKFEAGCTPEPTPLHASENVLLGNPARKKRASLTSIHVSHA